MPHPADFLTAVRLANLQLEPDEVDRLAAGIAGIIAHVEALRALDLDGVPPYTAAADDAAPLRPDEPGADPLQHGPEAFAPAWADGFFLVPRLETHRDDSPARD
jgi:aspartyl-tRNA(Asn)/glutamyl-tRNA(Gln) amidotransferase subunit C